MLQKPGTTNQKEKKPKTQPAKPRHNHLVLDLLFKHFSSFVPSTWFLLVALFPYLCSYLFPLLFIPHTPKPLSRSSCSTGVDWRPNRTLQSPVLLHTQSKWLVGQISFPVTFTSLAHRGHLPRLFLSPLSLHCDFRKWVDTFSQHFSLASTTHPVFPYSQLCPIQEACF